MTEGRETVSSDELHQFGVALTEAAQALYNFAAPRFTAAQIEAVRRTRDSGGAVEVRIQMRPTPYIVCVLENPDGEETKLFDLAPVAG